MTKDTTLVQRTWWFRGDRVLHPEYGMGTLLGDDDNGAHVCFDDGRRRTVADSVLRLISGKEMIVRRRASNNT